MPSSSSSHPGQAPAVRGRAGARGRSRQRSPRTGLQRQGAARLSPSPPPAFEPGRPSSPRCCGPITARPRRGAAATRCHPRPSPEPPESPRRAGDRPPRGSAGTAGVLRPRRFVRYNSGGDQTASQTQHLPVSMETPWLQHRPSDWCWTTGCSDGTTEPAFAVPVLSPFMDWNNLPLVFIHPDFFRSTISRINCSQTCNYNPSSSGLQ